MFLNNDEILKYMQYIETTFPVDEWMLNDVKVWPIIRSIFCEYYCNNATENTSTSRISRKATLMRYIKQYISMLKCFFSDWKHNIFGIDKSPVVFLSDNCSRNICIKGIFFNVNSDPLIEFFNKQKITIAQYEYLNSIIPKYPRYSSSIITDFWYAESILYSHTMSKIESCWLPNFDDFKQYCIDNHIVSKVYDLTVIVMFVEQLRYLEDKFYKGLKKRNCKLGLMVCWYSMTCMAFSLACHRLGIPCYDIQHGCAGASMHPFYYGWNKIPKDGYKLMPTGFWCWDEDDAKAIQNWDANGYRFDTIVGGRPIRDMIAESPAMFLSNKSIEVIETIQHDKRPKILVSLTTVFSIPQWCIDYIRRTDKYLWIVREHPCFDEVQTKITEQLKNFSHIIIDRRKDGIPLELDLMYVDCHVTHNSSVIIDAMAAGVRSIMLDKDSVNRYDYIARRGYCELATNEANLNSILEKKLQEKLFSICEDKNTEQGLSKLLSVVEK